jgi:hypothetical protein
VNRRTIVIAGIVAALRSALALLHGVPGAGLATPIGARATALVTPERGARVALDDRRRQLTGVRVTRVVSGRLAPTVLVAGRVAYDDTRIVDINLKLDGWISGSVRERDRPTGQPRPAAACTLQSRSDLGADPRQTVFVAQGAGRFEPRDVTVGERAGDQVLVIAGPRAHEEIATRRVLPRTDTQTRPVVDADIRVLAVMPPMPSMKMPAMRSEVRLAPADRGVYRGSLTLSISRRSDVSATAFRSGEPIATA